MIVFSGSNLFTSNVISVMVAFSTGGSQQLIFSKIGSSLFSEIWRENYSSWQESPGAGNLLCTGYVSTNFEVDGGVFEMVAYQQVTIEFPSMKAIDP